jgi:hypothetical protein
VDDDLIFCTALQRVEMFICVINFYINLKINIRFITKLINFTALASNPNFSLELFRILLQDITRFGENSTESNELHTMDLRDCVLVLLTTMV